MLQKLKKVQKLESLVVTEKLFLADRGSIHVIFFPKKNVKRLNMSEASGASDAVEYIAMIGIYKSQVKP